ncbi:MAG: hypothetical protein OP8BY_1735 [Candidatus Saccharicenans subterraneus]|uniref:Uncharacterized protein n=1 Tax=Candidatus Saccharicenans subterraneus TaxID=2508984 RepID=A0A3E2BPI7_9BACT|nr:MAG: hypothetical protein OP8BY_1735 [Candidatus Saccharicenans subterraneum]
MDNILFIFLATLIPLLAVEPDPDLLALPRLKTRLKPQP